MITQPKTSCGQVSPLISHPSIHTVPTRYEDTGDDAEIARILGELELQDACTRFSPSRPPYPRPPPCSPSPPSAAPPPYSSGHSFSTARRHQDSQALLPATPTRITYHYRTPTSQGDTTEWYVAPRFTFLLVDSFYAHPQVDSRGCHSRRPWCARTGIPLPSQKENQNPRCGVCSFLGTPVRGISHMVRTFNPPPCLLRCLTPHTGLKPKLSSAGCPIAFSVATRRSPLHTPPSTTPTDDCGLARLTMPVGNLSLPLPCPYPSRTRTLSIHSIAPKRTMTLGMLCIEESLPGSIGPSAYILIPNPISHTHDPLLASNANSIHSVSAIPCTSALLGKPRRLRGMQQRSSGVRPKVYLLDTYHLCSHLTVYYLRIRL